MCLLLYGQMVMTSIIEEKNNRVLEIVVSSVKPTHLMLGKICGIGLVAVTQILDMGSAHSRDVGPSCCLAIIPDTALTEMSALNAGTLDATSASMDVEILQAMSLMSNVGYILRALRAADTLPDRRISALCGHICCHKVRLSTISRTQVSFSRLSYSP